MESNLLTALIDNKIVKSGTKITVKRRSFDLSGVNAYKIEEILEVMEIYFHKSGYYILNSMSNIDSIYYKILAEQINIIDGMPPKILANLYNIKADGTIKPIGKKRGRKPKNKVA